jgi:large subunit ribosomal protein L25
VAEQRLELRPRSLLGRKVGRLRREGLVPAVIYGHGDSIPVQVEAHTFEQGYRRWGATTLLTLTGIDGDIPALVNNVTRNPRTGSLVHIDFFRVSLTEETSAEVPLHFFGDSRAVKDEHGVLIHPVTSVRVEALPQNIPHRIEVDLSRLETMDDEITIKDLSVDRSKVRLLDDPDELVAKVVPQRAEEVAPAPAAPEAVAAEGEGEEGAAAAAGAPAAGAPAAPAPAAGKTAPPAAGAKPPTAEKQQPAKK